MFRTALVVATLGLALIACRGDDTNTGDDVVTPDGPVIVGEVTVQEIQDPAMANGTQVELKGVVVTAIDAFGSRTGALWVQEPTGGEFSGIKVFGAPLDQIATLVPGDLVDITGAQKDEFACTVAICGADFDAGLSITELEPVEGGAMTIQKTGTGAVPAPAEVDAAAISLMPTKAERDAEWEKWEGVLIKAIKVRQLADVRAFGGADSMEDENEFRATGFARVQSALVALPSTSVAGVCYESVTGIVDFFFNYSIAPRTQADLVVGGTQCRPMATSVAMVQTATSIPELATLTGVYVTARDDIGGTNNTNNGFWVSDALAAAANTGVFVFTRTPADAAVVIGARVNVVGSVEEFDLGNPAVGDTVTEITNPTVSMIQAAAAPPVPATTATAATLADIGAAGEPWEGVLVRVGPVKVTNNNAGQGKVQLTDNNAGVVLADDESFAFSPQGSPVAVGTCYTSVTGVMHVQVNDNVRTLNPRNAGDLVVAANANLCN